VNFFSFTHSVVFPFSALTLLVGRPEGLGVGLLVLMICLELRTSYSSSEVVTTTSFIRSSSIIQNGDILLLSWCITCVVLLYRAIIVYNVHAT